MSDRGGEIEAFFFLLLRLFALVFGYLLLLGGGLFALAFLIEQMRTGSIALNGNEYSDLVTRLWLTVAPLAVVALGAAMVFMARRSAGKD